MLPVDLLIKILDMKETISALEAENKMLRDQNVKLHELVEQLLQPLKERANAVKPK